MVCEGGGWGHMEKGENKEREREREAMGNVCILCTLHLSALHITIYAAGELTAL